MWWRASQTLDLVNTPMLHCNIRYGEHTACNIFYLLGNPVRRNSNRDSRLVACDPAATERLRYGWRGATTAKEIGHNVPFLTSRLHDTLKQSFWFLRRISKHLIL